MSIIDEMHPQSGRAILENGSVINLADLFNSIIKSGTVSTYIPCLRKSVELTRPADTTGYIVGDIINGSGASTLPKISFGASYANRDIQITGASVVTDGTAKNLKVLFYNSSDINGAGGSVKADNVAFLPTYAEQASKSAAQPLTLDTTDDILTLAMRTASEKIRKVKLDVNGDFYFAPVLLEALTPASGQKFTFVFYCYVL